MTHTDAGFKALDAGRLAEAQQCFHRQLQHDAQDGRAWWGLGRCAALGAYRDEAINHYAHACRALPGEPQPLISLGEALSLRNRFSEAGQAFAEALRRAPNHADAQYAWGTHQLAAGEVADAEAALRAALALQPDMARAWQGLSRIKTFSAEDADLKAMNALLQRSNTSPGAQICLHYALAKASDDVDALDEAFAHWQRANHLQLARCRYRVADMAPYFQRIMHTPDTARQHRAPVTDTPVPVFILGQPRSGSTLLEQLLLNHSQVASAGETGYLGHEINRLAEQETGKPFPEYCEHLTQTQTEQLAAAYLRFAQRYSEGKPVVLDKLPANYQSIGLIRQILPQAKIVHLHRNEQDTCFSIFRQHFVTDEPFFCTLEEIGAYHQQYRSLMAHWRNRYPQHLIELRYEDLRTDTNSTMRTLLANCGLDWEPECAGLADNNRHISTLSTLQARSVIHSPLQSMSERYRPHLEKHYL